MQERLENSHQTKGLIRLTMVCNERCSFCNVPVEDYQRPTPPWEEIEQELELFVQTGQQTLTISGGEPTLLRKRLLRLIREAKSRGIPFIELQTNAVLLKKNYVAELVEAGLTSSFISFLSEQADLHDELVKLEGAFDSCVQGIENLIEAGVWVTLNPVLTEQTAGRLLEYIHFVHERFPKIKTISLSVVQPHGRAKKNWQLLPDYQELKELVPKAIALSKEYGIELLNPYCGLPICIGWTAELDKCVETIDHRKTFRPNIQNKGNKSKGPACQWCAFRVGCGGAWHQYWEVRAGSGIQAPFEIVPPWIEVLENEYQQVCFWNQGKGFQAKAPSVWLIVDILTRDSVAEVLSGYFTELVLFLDWKNPIKMRRELQLIQRLQKRFQATEQRIHCLIDRHSCSPQIQELWVELCLRLTLNLKVTDTLPEQFSSWGKDD